MSAQAQPPTPRSLPMVALPALVLAACVGSGDLDAPDEPDTADPTSPQDIQTIDLNLDLTTRTGRATLVVLPSAGRVTLDVGGLTLTAVTADGETIEPDVVGGFLSIPATQTRDPLTVGIDYVFPPRTPDTFDGWMPTLGVTFVWPSACGNLFPCDPAPGDGVTFTMAVVGVEEGLTAIFPASTHGDGPPYMAAVAVGDYTRLDLGSTTAGTTLSAWYLPGQDALADATAGTVHLLEVFDFFEQTYGPYLFGPEAGAVEVDWGDDSYGGMEHHPFFHVGKFDFDDEEAHAHEAAHAWFGDGVRIACWEDFVLSEGTTTYIAARALEQVGGPNEWAYYVDDFLVPICEGNSADPTLVNTVVLPETCGEIDFENDDLWSLTPYMKGACFYEEVADLIGPERLDAVIAEFYAAHVGGAARMGQMIDLIEWRAEVSDIPAIEGLVTDWLLSFECPESYAERCRTHGN